MAIVVLLASLSHWRVESCDPLRTEVAALSNEMFQQQASTAKHILDLREQVECLQDGATLNVNNTCPCTTSAVLKLQAIETELEYLREQIDYPSLPVDLRLTRFSRLRASGDHWLSVPFYACVLGSCQSGYLMRLIVYPNGTESGINSHMSVYVHLMKGKYDSDLSWPFQGAVKVTLVNRVDVSTTNQVSQTFEFSNASDFGARIIEGMMATNGQGYPRFVDHKELLSNTSYLQDDTLVFKVEFAGPVVEPPSPESVGMMVIIFLICCYGLCSK